VKATLVLCKWVSGNLVDESLQTRPPLLYEVLLKYPVVSTEWKLTLDGLAGQRWHHDLAVPLQLVSQPLKVGEPSPHT